MAHFLGQTVLSDDAYRVALVFGRRTRQLAASMSMNALLQMEAVTPWVTSLQTAVLPQIRQQRSARAIA
jgi:hypothetical protein